MAWEQVIVSVQGKLQWLSQRQCLLQPPLLLPLVPLCQTHPLLPLLLLLGMQQPWELLWLQLSVLQALVQARQPRPLLVLAPVQQLQVLR